MFSPTGEETLARLIALCELGNLDDWSGTERSVMFVSVSGNRDICESSGDDWKDDIAGDSSRDAEE